MPGVSLNSVASADVLWRIFTVDGRRPHRGHMFIRAVRLDVAVLACVLGTVVLPAASPRSAVPATPDDKTVVHVLNRIGFGPAPGDVERVRRVGLARYIDQQLDPRAIPDSDLAARLAPLTTLKLSTSEIADRYFVPAMMERRRAARLESETADEAPRTRRLARVACRIEQEPLH